MKLSGGEKDEMKGELNERIKAELKLVIESIAKIIEKDKLVKNKTLIEICRTNKIELVSSETEPHLIHELWETAINNFIAKNFNQADLARAESQIQTLTRLTNLLKRSPPQSWRGAEQIRLQQFSTPPTIAFLMAYLLNPLRNELILEPSAGTGSLAVWLKIADCRVHTNELSATRRILLELQGFEPTKIDAEFLDDLLPEEIIPDGFLMNPPFTSSGGRTKTGDANFGFRHIKSALARLKEGGRLVALLGSDTVTKTVKGLRFLSEINAEHDLKAIINLPKNAFYKYGTSIDTTIICIKKNEPNLRQFAARTSINALVKDCRNFEEVLTLPGLFD